MGVWAAASGRSRARHQVHARARGDYGLQALDPARRAVPNAFLASCAPQAEAAAARSVRDAAAAAAAAAAAGPRDPSDVELCPQWAAWGECADGDDCLLVHGLPCEVRRCKKGDMKKEYRNVRNVQECTEERKTDARCQACVAVRGAALKGFCW
jgi:hypothetical protein